MLGRWRLRKLVTTMIDWEITIEASQGPVTFGDEEGQWRSAHPNLRLENDPAGA